MNDCVFDLIFEMNYILIKNFLLVVLELLKDSLEKYILIHDYGLNRNESILLGNLDYNNKFSFLIMKRLIIQIY